MVGSGNGFERVDLGVWGSIDGLVDGTGEGKGGVTFSGGDDLDDLDDLEWEDLWEAAVTWDEVVI